MSNNNQQKAGNEREVASFHHDLRTQISAIVSLTGLLKKKPDPAKSEALLEALYLAANNAMSMVDDGAKMHRAPPTEARKLMELLEEFGAIAEGLTEAREASFKLDLDKSLKRHPFASPDPVYFHRLFSLLLDNAMKYAPKSDITLEARMEQGNELAIDFYDNGPGFGVADPSLLFEPYNRGKEGEKVDGSGLGLWSVKNIVTMMNGKIWARNNDPSGAIFFIRLPLEIAKDIADIADENKINGADLSLSGLVVDDNETNQLILGELLKAMDCGADHAQSGDEALKVLSEKRPDFVISDIRMAGMDGWALAGKIRENDDWNDIPVIAVSSDPVPNDLAPFDEWLQRPVDTEALQAILARRTSRS